MNSEKIQALFESMEVCANELKEATRQAKRIKIENDKNETVVKVVKDFKAVEGNASKLKKESAEAVKRMEEQASALKWTTLLATTAASILLGVGAGYIGIQSMKDEIIQAEVETLRAERAKIQEQYGFVNELRAKGFKVYSNAIVLPPQYADKELGVTKEGEPAIFADSK